MYIPIYIFFLLLLTTWGHWKNFNFSKAAKTFYFFFLFLETKICVNKGTEKQQQPNNIIICWLFFNSNTTKKKIQKLVNFSGLSR